MNELLTIKETADLLGIKERTLLEKYAPRPDFPNRVALSRKRFWWKRNEVENWLLRQQENRPKI